MCANKISINLLAQKAAHKVLIRLTLWVFVMLCELKYGGGRWGFLSGCKCVLWLDVKWWQEQKSILKMKKFLFRDSAKFLDIFIAADFLISNRNGKGSATNEIWGISRMENNFFGDAKKSERRKQKFDENMSLKQRNITF